MSLNEGLGWAGELVLLPSAPRASAHPLVAIYTAWAGVPSAVLPCRVNCGGDAASSC